MRSIIKEKKGSIIDLLIWIVVAFVIVLVFSGFIYFWDQITDKLTSIDTINPSVNISGAAEDSFGQVQGMQEKGLRTLAYVIIFAMGFSILLTNFLEKSHPAFFVAYLFVIIGAIIASVYISNQYELLLSNEVLGSTISSFKGASYLLLYLPVWTTVLGFFGAIFLFSGIMKDREAGGSF
jgi:hypothetical protein